MYGKLFGQMYDGTLATKGPWQALVTFQQLIILADKNGIVDMTPEAISRRTTVPLEVIQIGLERLAERDPESRSPTEEGRRIVLVSDKRSWGWMIVNHAHYRRIRSEEERREYHRQYMRKRRAVKSGVKASTDGDESQPNAVSRRQKARFKENPNQSGDVRKAVMPQDKYREIRATAVELMRFLNLKTGRSYEVEGECVKQVVALLKRGETPADIRSVIALKVREWGANPRMQKFLRPATLFDPEKFANYKGELISVN